MRDPIRIFAWGNRGRSDDGVALVLAERLEWRFAGDTDVSIQPYHQLGPEVADDLGRCTLAVFVDAHVRPDWGDVMVAPVEPADDAGLYTHHCPPPVLLALARSMGLRVPRAYLVSIRGCTFDFGDELSEAAAAGLRQAERLIADLVIEAKNSTQPEGAGYA